jgi:hypothetical protein
MYINWHVNWRSQNSSVRLLLFFSEPSLSIRQSDGFEYILLSQFYCLWPWPWPNQSLTLSSIYTHFYACATSADPDLPAHSWDLIKICTGCTLVRNKHMNHKANSIHPVHMVRMCLLIWIYTVRPRNKGTYIRKKRVKHVCRKRYILVISTKLLPQEKTDYLHLCNGLKTSGFLELNTSVTVWNAIIPPANEVGVIIWLVGLLQSLW